MGWPIKEIFIAITTILLNRMIARKGRRHGTQFMMQIIEDTEM